LKEKTMAATKTTKLTKAQVILALSEQTELSKKDVARIFEALSALVAKQLVGRGGPGEVTIPGLLKLKAVKKPATKEREGINPFTKEPITIAAKPASKKVKAIPIKALKEMVQ
jgi:DNA-binding protein HU-beta